VVGSPGSSPPSSALNTGSESMRGAQAQTKRPQRSIRALTAQLPIGKRSRFCGIFLLFLQRSILDPLIPAKAGAQA
jgi:hypothetical protein